MLPVIGPGDTPARIHEAMAPPARLPDGTVVAARQGHWLATSFHPELSDDVRFHQLFLQMVEEAARRED